MFRANVNGLLLFTPLRMPVDCMRSKKNTKNFDRAAAALAKIPDLEAQLQRSRAFLSAELPVRCKDALEIGCGLGEFSRFLALRSDNVLALDLSAEMIRIARERSAGFHNISYLVADAMEYPFPAARFDCVASFMTLHHMPLEEILKIVQVALKPGGVLVVFDLCGENWGANRLYAVFAKARKLARNLLSPIAGGNRRRARVWGLGYRTDFRVKSQDVRRICDDLLPGALVREHQEGERYSIVWRKPYADESYESSVPDIIQTIPETAASRDACARALSTFGSRTVTGVCNTRRHHH
jgi:SAM-dependent methyltransferase